MLRRDAEAKAKAAQEAEEAAAAAREAQAREAELETAVATAYEAASASSSKAWPLADTFGHQSVLLSYARKAMGEAAGGGEMSAERAARAAVEAWQGQLDALEVELLVVTDSGEREEVMRGALMRMTDGDSAQAAFATVKRERNRTTREAAM